MDAVTVVALCLALLAYALHYHRRQSRSGEPPGPIGLPIFGYLPFFQMNPAAMFADIAKKYGPVFSIELGIREWIVLNDYESVHEAFVRQGDKFAGRPELFITSKISEGHGIILVDYGPFWKSQRRFGITTLKDFGLGRTSTEDKIHEEAKHLVKAISEKRGKPFNCQSVLTNAVSNIICSIVMGSRFSYDDKRFVNIITRLSRSFSDKIDATLLAIMTLVPTARFLPFFHGAYIRQFEDLYSIFDTLREIVDEHKKTLDKENIRDFIDAYLVEMGRNTGGDSGFTEKQLYHYVRDIFVAGTDTTSNSLRWCILFLIHRKETQDKIVEEINSVIGDELPNMKHRDQMPYLRAWIQEVMRHRPMLPLMAPRKTRADVKINGYRIAKGTTVMGNMWAVHHQDSYFKDPQEFRPERFIDANGNYVPCEHVMPFSVGPRQCIGNQLVKMEMFIFLVSILQKFSVLPDPKNPPPSFHKGVLGFTYVPRQFTAIFERRKI